MRSVEERVPTRCVTPQWACTAVRRARACDVARPARSDIALGRSPGGSRPNDPPRWRRVTRSGRGAGVTLGCPHRTPIRRGWPHGRGRVRRRAHRGTRPRGRCAAARSRIRRQSGAQHGLLSNVENRFCVSGEISCYAGKETAGMALESCTRACGGSDTASCRRHFTGHSSPLVLGRSRSCARGRRSGREPATRVGLRRPGAVARRGQPPREWGCAGRIVYSRATPIPCLE